MANTVVLGTQWGDEGKGKIIDVLSAAAHLVARFAGGANAGHTVRIDGNCFALHLLPTGVLSDRAHSLIGNGVVVDLPILFAEIDELAGRGLRVESRLSVSTAAHLVLPYHRLLEARAENTAAGKEKIGTTMRGIGPAYADKAGRRGVRTGDLADPERLRRRVAHAVGYWESLSAGYLSAHDCTARSVTDELLTYRDRLLPMLADASRMIHAAIHDGRDILFEGAQGTLLDIDFGTYPYVTSSNTTIGGLISGLGVPPAAIERVVGVVKAYTTRVGQGPFPTELHGAEANHLQERGNEFGTTTGRRRRCGWLDLVALKYAVALSGITHVAITKLDVLDDLAEIPVCVAYEDEGVRSDHVPADTARFETVRPVYRTLPGWQTPTVGVTDYDDLPAKAREYLAFICDTLGVKLLLVSTGPGREETIVCNPGRVPATV